MPMAVDEIRRLAIQGTALVGLRTVVIRFLGLGANVVLARLLTPRDFGIVALATSIVGVTAIFTDAGVAAALVRRPEDPTRYELEGILGIQLLVALGIGGLVAMVALLLGGTAGEITALMALSLPLSAYRGPAAVFLERRLDYRHLATVEVIEASAYVACAISTVALGAGVWGLAAAVVLRSATGSAAMGLAARTGWLMPRLAWSSTRPLLNFGVPFLAIGVVSALQEQGLNAGITVLGGFVPLGVWSLVMKMMQAPFVVFETLWRVSYPATARLLAAGEDPSLSLERTMRTVAVGSGLLIAGMVGTAPALIPLAFGPAWDAAINVLPWVGLALVLNGPITMVAAGYLSARGDALSVVKGIVFHAAAMLAVGLSLLPYLGVPALGIGMVAGGAAAIAFFRATLRRLAPVRVLVSILPGLGAAVFAAAAGWWLAEALGPHPASIILSGLVILSVHLGAILILDRSSLLDIVRLIRLALRRKIL